MSKTEQRLTDALNAVAGSVPDDMLRPLTTPDPSADGTWLSAARRMLISRSVHGPVPQGRAQPWLAPVAAAAAIAVVIAAAATLPRLLHARQSSAAVAGAPIVPVGGFPTGIAYDAGSGTIYVSGGNVNALTMINTRTCNASQRSGCSATSRVSTGGGDPIGVAVNEATHTVYAVNGNSNTVAVINAATCNAVDHAGCAAMPPLISVGNGPEFLAVNPVTDTIYVANTGSGTVSVINGATCNASDTKGCGKPPATATAGNGAFPITVDAATNTVYVGLNNSVAVINGATCDAADTSGCAHARGQIGVSTPAGIAVDDVHHAVYISSEQGNVTVVDRNACDGADTAGCAGNHATVAIGSDPRGNALVTGANTLYATNAGSNTVSMINTATCNSTTTAGCAATPPAFPAGFSPRRIAVDPATHTVYVVNTGASTVSMINSLTCDATRKTGCPTKSPAGTTGPRGMAAGGGGMQSNCSPVETPAASGQPAGKFTSGSTQLASGSVDGMSWSLWAKKGVAEPAALEDGGVVLNGRWYGLCPGFPNVFEMELANLGPHGIDYGFVAFPGKAQVQLTSGGHVLPTPQLVRLKDVSFFIGSLPKSACAYKQMLTHARTATDSSMHELGFGSCQAGRVVDITGSDGQWGAGLSSWTAPGAGLGPSSGGASGGAGQSNCSPRETQATSGQPAGKFTSTSTELASGSVNGMSWTVRAKKGVAEPTALEDGGVVLNGRWYGLCPGFPNVFETELANLGPHGIDYGFVAYPGKAQVQLTSGGHVLPTPQLVQLKDASFFIGSLPKSACAYKVLLTHARTSADSSMHQLGFGRCQPGRVVDITGSDGQWGPGQSQWTMPGQGLAPASSFFGPGGGSGGGNLPNMQDQCSPGPTQSDSGRSAAAMTRSSVRVATGTAGGVPWSLWASRGSPGVISVEQGGLVVNGRWYGMCPGAPNPAEFELLNAGSVGLIYGYVANPGAYKIHLSASIPAPQVFRVRGGTFFIGTLPRSACDYSTVVLNAVTLGVDDMHTFNFSQPCRVNQLVTTSGGFGSW
jgi:YVTN family beta-propeller protein